ncbi:MAG: HAMP domain-containing sensor histidine kinase [Bacteroidetes bacterium]|nr:HAMP domain-containing sensor histidine kinase [Bacteroidota bacterium]
MRFTRKNILLAFTLSLAGLLLSGVFFSQGSNKEEELKEEISLFGKDLEQQQTLLKQEVEKLAALNSYEDLLQKNISQYSTLHDKQGISLYVYEDSILKFWSNNADPIENTSVSEQGFIKMSSGFYEKYSLQKAGKTFVGLLLIKKEHHFENSYVKNYFQKQFHLNETWKINITKDKGAFTSLSGNAISLLPDPNFSGKEDEPALQILEIMCLFLFVLALLKSIEALPLNYWIKIMLFAGLMYCVRWAMIAFHFPFFLYNDEIMDPQLFAYSSWFPSLGDLLMNAFSILAISYFIKGLPVAKEKIASLSNAYKHLLMFALFAVIFTLASLLIEVIEVLVFNSNLVLDAKKILKIDAFSCVAILGILLFLYAFLMLVKKSALTLKDTGFSWWYTATFLTSFFLLFLLLYLTKDDEDSTGLFLLLPILLLIFYRVFRSLSDFELASTIFLILFISLFVSATFETFLEIKEESNRKQKAILMASERDPIAEYLYIELAENMNNDTVISATQDSTLLSDYLRKNYFNKYWEKYDLQLRNISTSYRSPYMGTEVIPNTLYHNDNKAGKTGYIAKVTKAGLSEKWIELYPKNISDELGFPVLLVDKATENNTLSSEYSYAKYYQGKLVTSKGGFHYPVLAWQMPKTDFQWIERDGVNHLIYFADANTCIVISAERWGVWRMLSGYSYLFLLLGAITILAYIFYRLLHGKSNHSANFKVRLQLSMLAMLLFSGVIIGAGSIFFIKNQYNEKTFETINEKIKSVNLDIERRLTRHKAFNKPDVIKETLERFSKVFFTDINLYDAKGQILSTSRPDIFKMGLVSNNMDPRAFYELHFLHQSHFVGVEKIEGMEYLSAYIPFYNEKEELQGYLNLPYFSRQNELSNEISNFLVALINIYGLLIVFSILAALFVSDQITKPLSLIQEKLKNVRLGKRNESIEWKGNDEIGRLVAEYNRMVNELSDSADRLAKSEREGAWREMAKQVAHEIKNPLTPMKLNVQHLNRLWKDAPREEFEERLVRISKSLIEQIDALSSIATEFSNFAKMPDPIIDDVDLVEVLRNSVQLYSDENTAKVELETDYNILVIKADKDQLLRVFNNLIKNAIQAIPEERKGEIKVRLIFNGEAFLVMVVDNGKGISENDKEKIFIPNFTTKSSGMGLGLAMVKKIIEGMNGRIWFESQEGKGTCFYIEFKKIN